MDVILAILGAVVAIGFVLWIGYEYGYDKGYLNGSTGMPPNGRDQPLPPTAPQPSRAEPPETDT